MATTDELYQGLREDFADSLYIVERTPEGIDVRINVVDVQYYSILHKQGVKKVFAHHVAVDEAASSYTITDDAMNVRWKGGVDVAGGVPQIELEASVERQIGTVKRFEKRKTWAWDEDGKFGRVADYTFNSEDARRVVQRRASELGLEQRTGWATKIGIAAVMLAVLVVVVAMAIAFLTS